MLQRLRIRRILRGLPLIGHLPIGSVRIWLCRRSVAQQATNRAQGP
jgi:hypothetical protein